MKFFFYLILFTFDLKAETWQLGNVTYDLTKTAEGYLVNHICLEKKKCMALEKMNHVKRNQMNFDNKNPGSELCTQLQGEVFIAFRGKKSQGFCRFNDLSIISLDAFLKIANI
jgi:hypothetical protein